MLFSITFSRVFAALEKKQFTPIADTNTEGGLHHYTCTNKASRLTAFLELMSTAKWREGEGASN